jgi:lipopolysaccharide transport system permease protein
MSSRLPVDLRGWMSLNPMAGLVEAYQSVLCWGQPPEAGSLLVTASVAGVTLLLGLTVFSLGRDRIPEEV